MQSESLIKVQIFLQFSYISIRLVSAQISDGSRVGESGQISDGFLVGESSQISGGDLVGLPMKNVTFLVGLPTRKSSGDLARGQISCWVYPLDTHEKFHQGIADSKWWACKKSLESIMNFDEGSS